MGQSGLQSASPFMIFFFVFQCALQCNCTRTALSPRHLTTLGTAGPLSRSEDAHLALTRMVYRDKKHLSGIYPIKRHLRVDKERLRNFSQVLRPHSRATPERRVAGGALVEKSQQERSIVGRRVYATEGTTARVYSTKSELVGSWALDRIDQPYLPLDGYNFKPNRCAAGLGHGVHIYIIDTGCNTAHIEFANSDIISIPAPGSRYQSGSDDHGHGTKVASLVVGRNTGVATRAKVTCLKALDGFGGGSFSDVLAALDFVVAEKDKQPNRPVFVVLSLTSRAAPTFVSVDTAVSHARDKGVICFIAAGNKGEDACDYTPARSSAGITVGSVDSADKMTNFTNFGSCVDVVAPGLNVITAHASSKDAYTIMTGTSSSAPLVAGLVALLWNQSIHDARVDTKAAGASRHAKAIIKKHAASQIDGHPLPALNGICHGSTQRSNLDDGSSPLTVSDPRFWAHVCAPVLTVLFKVMVWLARYTNEIISRDQRRRQKRAGEPYAADDRVGTVREDEVSTAEEQPFSPYKFVAGGESGAV